MSNIIWKNVNPVDNYGVVGVGFLLESDKSPAFIIKQVGTYQIYMIRDLANTQKLVDIGRYYEKIVEAYGGMYNFEKDFKRTKQRCINILAVEIRVAREKIIDNLKKIKFLNHLDLIEKY